MNEEYRHPSHIRSHVEGGHLSPLPHRDTENDQEEAATAGDGDDEEESDMYTDDHRDADVAPTEPVPETETSVPVEEESHHDEPELGVSNEIRPMRDDDVDTNVLKGRGSLDDVAGSSDVHVVEEGDALRD